MKFAAYTKYDHSTSSETQLNTVRTHTHYVFKIHFNIILSFMLKSPSASLLP
jgi:hypothetical protein